jgi:transposase
MPGVSTSAAFAGERVFGAQRFNAQYNASASCVLHLRRQRTGMVRIHGVDAERAPAQTYTQMTL